MKRLGPLRGLSWAAVAVPLTALAADPSPDAVPASALQACAALTTESARLACYDKLAGRSAPASAPAPSAAASPAPAPAARATPAAPAALATAAQPPPAGAPAPGSPAAFGLYAAEHPKAALAPTKSETLRIVDVSHGPNGNMLLQLEGGQVWELGDGDALLTRGVPVTIHRAILGSFLVTTPSGRTHRAKRVQ